MSRANSTEQQSGAPEIEASEGTVIQEKIRDEKLKLNIIEAKEEVVKAFEEEECKTPTWSGSLISINQKCPPAPRKKRPNVSLSSSHLIRRSLTAEFHFVEDTELHQEVELFFHSLMSDDSSRVSKRCRSA